MTRFARYDLHEVKEGRMKLTASFHSPRWGHSDKYEFEYTTNGWTLHGKSAPVELPPDCGGSEGRLIQVLENDQIYPPAVLDTAMEYLWRAIKDGRATQQQAQAALDDLVNWINNTMLSKPKGFWASCF